MSKEEIWVYGLVAWSTLMWGIYLIINKQNKDD